MNKTIREKHYGNGIFEKCLLKETVHPKIKLLSSFTHLQVPNLYKFFSVGT